MSIFGSIMSKIFHAATGSSEASANPAPQAAQASSPAASPSSVPPQDSPAAQNVDVEAVLTEMASRKGGGGKWQTSIVDLLKLLDLDSSLGARKELGNELSVHTGADGSAEQNIGLHKAVMQKLAENGGKVPDSMKS